MHHSVFNKIFPNHDCYNWQKQILYFTLAKYWQNIGNRYSVSITTGKSLVDTKIYECIGKRLAVIDNKYFTNRYQYIITLLACVIIF